MGRRMWARCVLPGASHQVIVLHLRQQTLVALLGEEEAELRIEIRARHERLLQRVCGVRYRWGRRALEGPVWISTNSQRQLRAADPAWTPTLTPTLSPTLRAALPWAFGPGNMDVSRTRDSAPLFGAQLRRLRARAGLTQ